MKNFNLEIQPDPILNEPAYSAAEVGRLVGLTSNRVQRWLKGYEYQNIKTNQKRVVNPVINRDIDTIAYASFLELIDMLFVKKFLDRGISLQKLRKALSEANQILGTSNFAREIFFTDGKNIYLKVKNQGDAILQLLNHGQYVIPQVILELAHRIDFDAASGFAKRWYPQGPNNFIVIDPAISFGRPSIKDKRITTANIYDLYLAENKNRERVSSWFEISTEETSAAIQFEEKIAA